MPARPSAGSVDRSPRTRGGIGCTSSCYPRLRFASVAL